MSLSTEPVRINVLLPADVAKTLRDVIPPRKRAKFVANAVERELRRVQLELALDASAGSWQDADHPELIDGPAIDRWIAAGRAQLNWDRERSDCSFSPASSRCADDYQCTPFPNARIDRVAGR